MGRYVSLASIVASCVVAILGWVLNDDGSPHVLPIVLTVLSGLVILRHRANIGRLLQGRENRFGSGRKKTP